ncbi:MAG: hypothetical protein LBR61_05600 [Synergistaceae bacterium]|jgi:hypothetical protein|nr:hypothetical protein [Synergistaceae bacterium]
MNAKDNREASRKNHGKKVARLILCHSKIPNTVIGREVERGYVTEIPSEDCFGLIHQNAFSHKAEPVF